MTRFLGKCSVAALSLAALMLAAQLAEAQPGGFGGGQGGRQGRGGGRGRGGTTVVTLAGNAEVQTLIAASDAQKTKITEITETLATDQAALQDTAGDDFAAMIEGAAKLTASAEDKVAAALDEAQNIKVLSILVQLNGGPSLTNSQVAKHLKVTEEQAASLTEVAAANRGRGGGGRRGAQMSDEDRAAQEKLYTDVLTTEQQAEYAKLKEAAPVDDEFLQQLRPRGRGGRGGAGAGGGGRGGRGGRGGAGGADDGGGGL